MVVAIAITEILDMMFLVFVRALEIVIILTIALRHWHIEKHLHKESTRYTSVPAYG